MAKLGAQLDLFVPKPRAPRKARGKRRGPKPRAERRGFVPHVARAPHERRHPVHVSMRRTRLAPSLRSQRLFSVIAGQLAVAKRRGVRVAHFAVQEDHMHLMVEAEDGKDLSRKMQLLFSRIAMAVNRAIGRKGSLFADRHHRHELRTPTETRRTLVYILFNTRKHVAQECSFSSNLFASLDAMSSAPWFSDWHAEAKPPAEVVARSRAGYRGGPPLSPPETWLARVGWKRAGGAVRFDEPLRIGR